MKTGSDEAPPDLTGEELAKAAAFTGFRTTAGYLAWYASNRSGDESAGHEVCREHNRYFSEDNL